MSPEKDPSTEDEPRIGGKTTAESQRDAEVRIGWRMGGMGMEVTAQVVAGAALGWLWDRWQGTAPTGITIGAIAGIVVGMWTLIKGALKLNRDLERAAPTKGRGKPIPPEPQEDDWDKDDWKKDDWDDWDNDGKNGKSGSNPPHADRSQRHDD